jgi:tRNA(Ile2) C34 agmatinyltransferase TiaS
MSMEELERTTTIYTLMRYTYSHEELNNDPRYTDPESRVVEARVPHFMPANEEVIEQENLDRRESERQALLSE